MNTLFPIETRLAVESSLVGDFDNVVFAIVFSVFEQLLRVFGPIQVDEVVEGLPSSLI